MYAGMSMQCYHCPGAASCDSDTCRFLNTAHCTPLHPILLHSLVAKNSSPALLHWLQLVWAVCTDKWLYQVRVHAACAAFERADRGAARKAAGHRRPSAPRHAPLRGRLQRPGECISFVAVLESWFPQLVVWHTVPYIQLPAAQTPHRRYLQSLHERCNRQPPVKGSSLTTASLKLVPGILNVFVHMGYNRFIQIVYLD